MHSTLRDATAPYTKFSPNLNMTKQSYIVFLFIISACGLKKEASENSEKTPIQNQYTQQDFEQLKANWKFFSLEETQEVIMIDYLSAWTRCGRAIDNGVAIVMWQSDTIRIIDQCPDRQEYYKGDILIFEPQEPILDNNGIGLVYISEGPNPKVFEQPNVKKTTFGHLKIKTRANTK